MLIWTTCIHGDGVMVNTVHVHVVGDASFIAIHSEHAPVNHRSASYTEGSYFTMSQKPRPWQFS